MTSEPNGDTDERCGLPGCPICDRRVYGILLTPGSHLGGGSFLAEDAVIVLPDGTEHRMKDGPLIRRDPVDGTATTAKHLGATFSGDFRSFKKQR